MQLSETSHGIGPSKVHVCEGSCENSLETKAGGVLYSFAYISLAHCASNRIRKSHGVMFVCLRLPLARAHPALLSRNT